MSDFLLETRLLTKDFKGHRAVNEISLKVEKEKIYGLLGANGAGKSTTLKMITGILNPTSGDIIFDGHKLRREDLRNIGSLIESPAIYENLTSFENLKVHALLFGIGDERIYEVLSTVGLNAKDKKKAGNFSLGMKQRLGIAIALLTDPKLLILDEPTNGLDPLGIEELRNLIKSFPEKGITVILSSHNLKEVEQLADYIGIINNGILGYQDEIDRSLDLEELFMSVVKKTVTGDDKHVAVH